MSVAVTGSMVTVSGLRLHPEAPLLDFSLGEGEAISILGANGSGKSRLLAALIGQADCGGSVTIRGYDSSDPATRRRALSGVGILFQESGLLRDLDVESNISLPAKVRGWPTGEDARKETEILLSISGCTYARHSFASEISAGESRRIALSRSLAGGSDILLLDEPVAGLSTRHRETVLELLATLRQHGVISALIVFTDDSLVASRLSEASITLTREGTVFGIPGPLKRFTEEPNPAH